MRSEYWGKVIRIWKKGQRYWKEREGILKRLFSWTLIHETSETWCALACLQFPRLLQGRLIFRRAIHFSSSLASSDCVLWPASIEWVKEWPGDSISTPSVGFPWCSHCYLRHKQTFRYGCHLSRLTRTTLQEELSLNRRPVIKTLMIQYVLNYLS